MDFLAFALGWGLIGAFRIASDSERCASGVRALRAWPRTEIVERAQEWRLPAGAVLSVPSLGRTSRFGIEPHSARHGFPTEPKRRCRGSLGSRVRRSVDCGRHQHDAPALVTVAHTDRTARLHLRATFRDEAAAWSSLAHACTEITQDERLVAAVVSGILRPRA